MKEIHPLAELAPRDTVASAIYNQMKKDNVQNVYLSLKHLNGSYIKERFSAIYEEILKKGLDITTDLVPIAPAAHYMVGGIQTGLNGETSISGLWACGEVASSGVMGANRLASNSLLECLVFSKRAAEDSSKLVKKPLANIELKEIVYDKENIKQFLDYKNEISDIMSNNVCLVRNAEGLSYAVKRLNEIRNEFSKKTHEYNLNKINNIANIGFLISNSALTREESRGGHVREDYPETNPEMEFHIVQNIKEKPVFIPVRKK